MWVRAFEEIGWSIWRPFTLTTQANHAPTVAIADHALRANDWAHVADWISYSDPEGSPASQYQFYDGGTAASSAHFWSPGSGNIPSGGNLTVATADLGSVWLGGATAGGTEQIWARAFDGADWSTWRPFTLTDSLV